MSHSDWDNMLCGDKMSLTAGDLLCTVFMLLDGLSSLHKGLLLRVSFSWPGAIGQAFGGSTQLFLW